MPKGIATHHEAAPPRRVVVFGGTFDPPHRAHTELPALVLDALDADELRYVPAGRSPFKLGHEQSPPHHRLAMLRLALRGIDRTVVDPLEIERGDNQPSFTIDTVRHLRDTLGGETELRLLIGTDQLFSFALWKDAEELAMLAPLAVLVRPPHTREQALDWLGDEAPTYLESTTLIDAPHIDVSSSQLREMIGRDEDITAWVARDVSDYIRRQGLYREPNSPDENR